jgi:hypothetical protein
MSRLSGTFFLVLSLLGLNAFASGDEKAIQGREILKKNQDAVVTVRLVIKEGVSSSAGSHQSESKSEAKGTVIDASGLVVMSLSEADPSDIFNGYAEGDEEDSVRYQAEIAEVKIVFADGVETPAKMALRDKDLDLAFIRPTEKPAKPVPFVDLTADAHPELLDELVLVDRLPRSSNRTPHVCFSRVEAKVEKPRTFYVTDRGTLGCPAFSLDGKIVGITLMQSNQINEDTEDYSTLPTDSEGIILPASEIREVARQTE